jgi:formamidopyrimidine-DNA glycosylase
VPASRPHPSRPARQQPERHEIRRLHAAIQSVLRGAIATGGTSFAGYINDFRGWAGYLDHAEVFRWQGQPCRVRGTLIIRTKVAGRGTSLCPHCQQL